MLELETGLFFWTAVSFGILTVLLYKVALPPLLTFLAQREKMIADAIADAAANQSRSEELLVESKKKLAELHHTADKLIAQAREEGRQQREEIVAKADKQADLILERNRLELAREKDNMLRAIRSEVADLVVSAAGKVLGREVGSRDNRRIIEESLKQQK